MPGTQRQACSIFYSIARLLTLYPGRDLNPQAQKAMDFESTASTNSATEAIHSHCTVYCVSEKGGILLCAENDGFINTDVTKSVLWCSGCIGCNYVNCRFGYHDAYLFVSCLRVKRGYSYHRIMVCKAGINDMQIA